MLKFVCDINVFNVFCSVYSPPREIFRFILDVVVDLRYYKIFDMCGRIAFAYA